MYYAVSSGLCGGISAQEICRIRIQNRRGPNGGGMITKPLKYTEHKLSLNVKEFVCAALARAFSRKSRNRVVPG